jgi:hypothetical protein
MVVTFYTSQRVIQFQLMLWKNDKIIGVLDGWWRKQAIIDLTEFILHSGALEWFYEHRAREVDHFILNLILPFDIVPRMACMWR